MKKSSDMLIMIGLLIFVVFFLRGGGWIWSIIIAVVAIPFLIKQIKYEKIESDVTNEIRRRYGHGIHEFDNEIRRNVRSDVINNVTQCYEVEQKNEKIYNMLNKKVERNDADDFSVKYGRNPYRYDSPNHVRDYYHYKHDGCFWLAREEYIRGQRAVGRPIELDDDY